MNPQKLTPQQAIELLKKGIAHPSLKLSQQEHFNLLNAIKTIEEGFEPMPKEIKDVSTSKFEERLKEVKSKREESKEEAK